MPSERAQLVTLKNLIEQADLTLGTTDLPENHRSRELLTSALALTDDLITQIKMPAASVLGRKGGAVTAQRGPDYFRQLAAKRKTRAGGRPRKDAQ
jgi:hypothetical protein